MALVITYVENIASFVAIDNYIKGNLYSKISNFTLLSSKVFFFFLVCRQRGRVIKSITIVIVMVSVQNLLAPIVVSSEKTLNGTFSCLAFLTSSSKFQSYFYKIKKINQKFQADSNIMASPEADRSN